MRELTADELDEICWKHVSSLPYFRGMLRAVEHSLYARFDIPGPILDVGAGDGHFAEAYLTGQQSLGVDPWWQPLREAAGRKVYALLVQANGSALPLPPASFAYAISNSVLEHIPNVQLVLNDIGRVMAPGGMFYFAVPNQHFRTDLWGMQVLNALGLHSLATRYERFFNRIARHVNLDPPEVDSPALRAWNTGTTSPSGRCRCSSVGMLRACPICSGRKRWANGCSFPRAKTPSCTITKSAGSICVP